MSQIKKNDTEFTDLRIPIRAVLGYGEKDKLQGYDYERIRNAAKELQGSYIEIIEGNKWATYGFISKSSGEKGKPFIVIRFNNDMKGFLLQLKSAYTSYTLKHVSNFKNKSSLKIYELCKEYLNQGRKKREFDLVLLREVLGFQEKYLKFYELKRKVLEAVKDDINSFSDMNLEYMPQKNGRSVKAIQFTFDFKEGNPQDQKLSESFYTPSGASFSLEENTKGGVLSSFGQDFYKKLLRRYNKKLLDFSMEKVALLSHVNNKRGYLLKAMKEEYYRRELELMEAKKIKQVELKEERILKEKEKLLEEKIRQQYDSFRKQLFEKFRGKGTEEDLEEFLFEMEESSLSLERRYFSEFERGRPSKLADSYYCQWLIKKYGTAEEIEMLDEK
ncbi:replication initiation protein, partial [Xanthovirga aplysinae]|uniref:replication initiation protein n=1 Tax=Xanthovirga aplysinae TaxID=2529853 RepID=UPI00165765D0